jgi:hypothetical protein
VLKVGDGFRVSVVAPAPRPQFDGDMRTMERIVPDFLALFRSVKVLITQNWRSK